jgi:4-diphosphocytidyl-2-C-methyl-D-erythritol kinase
MIVYPNAKINLGLHVTEKRDDGFHNIETLIFPVPLFDILEILPAIPGTPPFRSSGLPIPGSENENLCLKAVELFQSAVGNQRSAVLCTPSPVSIHLHKQIPTGSGLGGGSSDGAFTLKLLNNIHGHVLDERIMLEMATTLGSDCPFFILNRPLFATGRGDVFTESGLSLKGFYLAIVIPPVHVSTAEAYSMVKPFRPGQPLPEIIRLPIEQWKDKLVNDFEGPVFERYPLIRNVKEKLYDSGALYASMSGSGSAVYGLFTKPVDLSGFFSDDHFTFVTEI